MSFYVDELSHQVLSIRAVMTWLNFISYVRHVLLPGLYRYFFLNSAIYLLSWDLPEHKKLTQNVGNLNQQTYIPTREISSCHDMTYRHITT